MNKFLIVAILFTVIVFVTACAMKKSADTENNSVDGNNASSENVDYIVTTVIPKTVMDGIKDTAEPGYVPINPNYNTEKIPSDKGKIAWFTTGLGSKIPPFPEGKLLEVINTDKEFVAYIANVDEKTFQSYFEFLLNNGYIGEINTWECFTLFSPKIAVNLRYWQEPGHVSTIRARFMSNGEYDKMKSALKNQE